MLLARLHFLNTFFFIVDNSLECIPHYSVSVQSHFYQILHKEIEPMAIVLWLKHPDDTSFLRGLKKQKQGKGEKKKQTTKHRERKRGGKKH